MFHLYSGKFCSPIYLFFFFSGVDYFVITIQWHRFFSFLSLKKYFEKFYLNLNETQHQYSMD